MDIIGPSQHLKIARITGIKRNENDNGSLSTPAQISPWNSERK
jgi:hypothetical protein